MNVGIIAQQMAGGSLPIDITMFDGFDSYADTTNTVGFQTRWTWQGTGNITVGSFMENAPIGRRIVLDDRTTGKGRVSRGFPASKTMGFSYEYWYAQLIFGLFFGFVVREGSTPHIAIQCDSLNGEISVYRATDFATLPGVGTLLGKTRPGVAPGSSTAFIRIEDFVCDTVNGGLKLYVNDVLELTLSGVNTQNGGTGFCDNAVLNDYTIPRTNAIVTFDHFAVTTGRTAPRLRVRPIYPAADIQKQWTPYRAGTNWDAYGPAFPILGRYCATATAGAADIYEFGNLTDFKPIMVKMVMWGNASSATGNNVVMSAYLGAHQFDYPIAMSTTSGRYDVDMPLAPDGGPWTIAKVNALRGGPRRPSGTTSNVFVDMFMFEVVGQAAT